ncbi:hypothetical protein DL98DRAFT_631471 [Cadophora sp. DSE1049]|nr:hypothetical protein DL98DRAFT_631471 [Cadophora sp. DSE1049]
MPSLFDTATNNGPVAPATSPRIFISTPKGPISGAGLYKRRVDAIVRLLTGPGQPLHGVRWRVRGYSKLKPWEDEKKVNLPSRGKVLLFYDNNQGDNDEEAHPSQMAIWRLLLEDDLEEERWTASQLQAAACAAGRKRQVDGTCSSDITTLSMSLPIPSLRKLFYANRWRFSHRNPFNIRNRRLGIVLACDHIDDVATSTFRNCITESTITSIASVYSASVASEASKISTLQTLKPVVSIVPIPAEPTAPVSSILAPSSASTPSPTSGSSAPTIPASLSAALAKPSASCRD